MRFRVALIAAFTAACGPKGPSRQPKPSPDNATAVWISPALQVHEGNFAAALEKPFEYAVSVADASKNAAIASSCKDYFRLKEAAFGAISEEDHNLWRSEGVRCEAIKRAAVMQPGAGQPAEDILSDGRLLKQLPATVGPSISDDELALRKASAAQGQSWMDYAAPLTLEQKDGAATVSEVDTISRLTPLAAGDLNQDGAAEVLVEALCHGTEGTWVDIRLLVLSPVRGDTGVVSYRLVENVMP